jgi:hypothetical protein
MSGGGSATSAAAAAPAAADDDSQSPASSLFPAFSQHLHGVEWAGGSGAGGAAVAVARRTALSSLWQWLQAARSAAKASEGAARRLILLYRSVTAEQVKTLCNVIRRAAVDGKEDEVSQRPQTDQPLRGWRKKRSGGWLRCCEDVLRQAEWTD